MGGAEGKEVWTASVLDESCPLGIGTSEKPEVTTLEATGGRCAEPDGVGGTTLTVLSTEEPGMMLTEKPDDW
jgi:hypothetical protein